MNRSQTVTWRRRFPIWGAGAALLGVLVAEPVLWLLRPPVPAGPPVQIDIPLVLDTSGSMTSTIAGVQRSIVRFVSCLKRWGLDAQVGVVAFRDSRADGPPQSLRFNGQLFSADGPALATGIRALSAGGGGGREEESSLDGLLMAGRYPFRPNAKRVVVLLTDTSPNLPDQEAASVAMVVDALRDVPVDDVVLVVPDGVESSYEAVRAAFPGVTIPLQDVVTGRQGLERILPYLIPRLQLAAPSLLYSEPWPWTLTRVTFVSSVWAGLVTAMLGLGLVVGQARCDRTPVSRTEFRRYLALSAGLGLGVGLLVQLLYALLAHFGSTDLAWLVAWIGLAGCTGCGLSRIVPNLSLRSGSMAGLIGGLISGLAFQGAAWFCTDVICRAVGGAILGLAIGWVIEHVHSRVTDTPINPPNAATSRRNVVNTAVVIPGRHIVEDRTVRPSSAQATVVDEIFEAIPNTCHANTYSLDDQGNNDV